MKKYFKYFCIPFILVGIITIAAIAIFIAKRSNLAGDKRYNPETDLSGNVFDYADRLSDAQEAELEVRIINAEEKLKCDIAVVILDEPLADAYNTSVSHCVQYFADEFTEYHKMGYEKPNGSSIVFVDNLYRERDGKVYSWISTTGTAKDKLSTASCEAVMDYALVDLNDDSDSKDLAKAYGMLVDALPDYWGGQLLKFFKPSYILGLSFLVAIIYILVNWSSKVGNRTTFSTTYVVNGRPNMRNKRDVFLRKSISKVRIQQSSGGGSGGGSHGGGGHSR